MIQRLILILTLSSVVVGCDSTIQPEIVSVDGKEYSETIIDPIIEHPKLLTPLDSLRANFSRNAKLLDFEGFVAVTITIDSAGVAKDPKIMRGGNEQINQVAKQIVESAKFEPAKQNGRPVSVRYFIPFNSKW